MAKTRESNMELLRIVTMFLIVLHHAIYWGSGADGVSSFSNKFILHVMFAGNLGVNLFVLITGYYVDSVKFSVKRLLKLAAPIYFYTIGLSLALWFMGIHAFPSAIEWRSLCLPITYKLYWFASEYVVLFFLLPVFRYGIEKLSKGLHLAIVVLGFFVMCVAPNYGLAIGQFSEITWFIYLVFVGAFFKRHTDKITGNLFICGILLLVVVGVYAVMVYQADVAIAADPEQWQLLNNLRGINKIPYFIMTLAIFLVFKNLRVKHNRLINAVAATTFGIYLIHEHPFMRSVVWSGLGVIKLNEKINVSGVYAAWVVALAVVVFVFCAVIDFARIKLVETPLMAFINKIPSHKDKSGNLPPPGGL